MSRPLRSLALLATATLMALATAPARAEAPLARLSLRPRPPGVAPVPVAIGVPIAAGRLAAGAPVTLRRDDGRRVPCDARVLERWPDGSTRWLLLDVLPAAGARALPLALVPGPPPPAPEHALRVREEAGAIEVDNGLVRLRVTGAADSILTLRPSRESGPAATAELPWPGVRLGDASTVIARREAPRLESHGTLRTEILLSARDDHALAHEVRIAAFAGVPWVRVRYTLTQDGDTAYLPLRGVPLWLRTHATSAELATDGASRRLPLSPDGPGHTLAHRAPMPALLDGVEAGRRADGTARALGGGLAWTVVVPRMWEEYPNAIGVAADGVHVTFAAAPEDAPLLFGVGAAKTWEVWLAAEPAAGAAPLAALPRPDRAEPLVTVVPAAVPATGAIAQAVGPSTPGAAGFLRALTEQLGHYRARAAAERWDEGPPGPCRERGEPHVHVGFYGALNWGDWNFPGFRDEAKGCDAWGNLEYDMPLVLGLAWLATGDPALRPAFDDAARHFRDVDVIHRWPGHEAWVGLDHPHKVRHFATDAPNTVDLGHVWLEGLLLHHRLTGEERSREAALHMADALAAMVERARNPRQFGWPMVALAAAYEASGREADRAAALAYARAGAPRFSPDPDAGDWKLGILAAGMVAVHRATADADVRRWLDAYGAALLAKPSVPRDPRLVAPAGYLYRLTGDRRYAELAERTAATLPLGNWGKTIASMGRVGFRLLAPLDPAAPAPPGAAGNR